MSGSKKEPLIRTYFAHCLFQFFFSHVHFPIKPFILLHGYNVIINKQLNSTYIYIYNIYIYIYISSVFFDKYLSTNSHFIFLF